MIVSCPQCQARYKLDPNKIAARGAKITCPRCRHVFVVYPEVNEEGATTGLTTLDRARPRPKGLQDDPTAPVHRVQKPRPKRSAEDLDFRKVGIASWKVKVKIGLVYDFSDIKTLRKYIQDGRVTPEDVISHNAKDWVTIGDIPDLDAYFVEVYEREEDALANGRKGNEFEEDTPTNVVGMGSLGNDLAAQALAEASRDDEIGGGGNEHGPAFVDPFAALKDKQRERIQDRRKSGGRKAAPPPEKESGSQKGLLIAALVLIALGGGAWWFLSQGEDPVSSNTTSTQDALQSQKAREKQEAARDAVNEKLQEDLQEIERDDIGGTADDDDPILIPIGPRGEPTRKPSGELLSENSTGTGGGTTVSALDSKKDCQDFTRAGDWGQAKMACNMALKDSPGNPAVMVNLGIALYENGELNASNNQLSGASQNGSTDPRIKKYMGHIARERGDVMGASGYYQDYLAANPNASDKAKIEALLTQLQGG